MSIVLPELAEAMRQRGLHPPPSFSTGTIVRFNPKTGALQGGDRDAWYVLHSHFANENQIYTAVFGDWHNGQWSKWRSNTFERLPSDQKQRLEAKIQADIEEARRQQQKRWYEAHQEAQRQYEVAAPCKRHSYLQAKGVKAVEGLKVDAKRNLLVPFRDLHGRLWTLLKITQDGTKRFLPGGKKKGHFFQIGTIQEKLHPILLAEGLATALTLHEATNLPVICCGDAGNLVEVAGLINTRWNQHFFLVCGDDDWKTTPNTGRAKAEEAAQKCYGFALVPEFSVPDRAKKDTDFNDLARLEGLEVVELQVETALHDHDRLVKCLKSIEDPLWREKKLKVISKLLSLPQSTLRQYLTQDSRPQCEEEATDLVERLEPWPSPVDGRQLIQEIITFLDRHMSMAEYQKVTVGLWTFHTYNFNKFHYTPYLFIEGPTKACGKSRLLRIVQNLSHWGLSVSDISEAALVRVISKHKPTICVDEFDELTKRRSDLTGILNGGFERGQPSIRAIKVKDDYEAQAFDLYCPKAFAGIDVRVAPALRSRAIQIKLARKPPGQEVEPLPYALFEALLDTRRKLLRWTQDNVHKLTIHLEQLAPLAREFGDRARDLWVPLYAVAHALEENWPERCLEAARAICGASDDRDPREKLVHDIAAVFDEIEADRISSSDLVKKLKEIDVFWGDLDGRPLTQARLADMLRPFGVKPNSYSFDGKTKRGYLQSDFEDVFRRYLLATEVDGDVITDEVQI